MIDQCLCLACCTLALGAWIDAALVLNTLMRVQASLHGNPTRSIDLFSNVWYSSLLAVARYMPTRSSCNNNRRRT